MNSYDDEQSSEPCPSRGGGFCGRIDFDDVYRRLEPGKKVSNETAMYLLIAEAEELMYRNQYQEGLEAYLKAYAMAMECEELGADAMFGVMFHIHYFGFEKEALRMCWEIAEVAANDEDVSLLRDLWRLLPDIGNTDLLLFEEALELRDLIETNHPEVLTYERSSRF